MKNKADLEKRVNIALDSLNQMERASAPPYFFTRLEARMQKGKTFWEKSTLFLTNPVFSFASITLILLFNIYVIASSPDENNITQQDNELATIDEYNQVSSTLFDFENIKP
ncbi:MAG: hypothetical protein ABIN48_03430 [Ginsengibacter sp.]